MKNHLLFKLNKDKTVDTLVMFCNKRSTVFKNEPLSKFKKEVIKNLEKNFTHTINF